MNVEDLIDLLITQSERKIELYRDKAHDYAQKDVLSNFKVMAEIEQVLEQYGYKIDISKAWGVAMWHLMHKIVRILNLYNKGERPSNETTGDSHLDLEMYSHLAMCCYSDEHPLIIDTTGNAQNPT